MLKESSLYGCRGSLTSGQLTLFTLVCALFHIFPMFPLHLFKYTLDVAVGAILTAV